MKNRKELKEFRTATSKSFLNHDGTIQIELFKEPIYYLDKGEYKEINNSLERTPRGYKNKNNDFKIEFNDSNQPLQINISYKNKKLSLIPKETDNIVTGNYNQKKLLQDNSSNSIIYEEIYINTNLKYQVLSNQLKESIILKNSTSKNRFKYDINTSLMLVLNEDNTISFMDNEIECFKIEKPYMFDSKNVYSESIKYELKKTIYGYELIIDVDKEWLNDKYRSYPVVIDPTITNVQSSSSVIDTYIFDGDENSTTYNQPYLYVGTDKSNVIYRGLLKFELPKIPAGYKVIDASLVMSCYPDEFGLAYQDKVPMISVHKLTQNWSESSAKWENMSNNYSSNIEDYCYANRMDSFHQEPGYDYKDTFNITSLVQKWYNGEPNYGIMLKEYNEEVTDNSRPAFYVSKDYDDTSYSKPLISITYKNFNGIESYLSYTTQEHNFGEASINNYTGNLTITYDVANTVGGGLPANLYLVYNTTDVELNNDYGYGLGIKPSLIQTLVKEIIEEQEFLKYTDEDGTIHYFYRETTDSENEEISYSNEYFDEDGLDLSVEFKDEYYVMTDKAKNISKFVKHNDVDVYYLEEIQNVDGKKITITYDSQNRISKVIDGLNQEIIITYSDSKIYFVSPHLETIVYLENNLITKISSLGITENIIYNENSLIDKIINSNGLAIKYEYINQISFRVKKVSEISKLGNEGNYLVFSYNLEDTKIVDNEGHVNTYIFNSYGNLIGITSIDENENLNQAYGKSYAFGNEDEGTSNKLISDNSLINYIDNLIDDSSFEGDESMRFTNGDINSTNTTSNVASRSGLQSLEIGMPRSGGYIYKEFVVPKGKTYTFSGYIRGTSLVKSVEDLCLDFILSYDDIQAVTHITKLTNDFVRYSVTIEYSATATDNLKLTIQNVDARPISLYLDDIQLEEGEVANYYNLVDNSSFKKGTSGWTINAETTTEYAEINELPCGVKALKVHSEPIGYISVDKRFNVKGKAGDTYNLSFWYKNFGIYPSGGEGLMPGCWATIFFGYNDGMEFGACVPAKYLNIGSDNWQFFSENFQAEWDYDYLEININNFGGANDCYYTNFSLFKDLEAYSYDYDENGNLVSSVDLTREKSSLKYDNSNQIIGMTDPLGNNYTFEYDNNINDRIIGSFSPSGVTSSIKYDNNGNIVATKVTNKRTLAEINNEIKYLIRAKGTNKYFYINPDKTIRMKESECSYDKFYIVKDDEHKVKIKHAVLNNYFIKVQNSEVKLQYGDNNNEFELLSNLNNSYSIALPKSGDEQYKVLTLTDTFNIILSEYNSEDYRQEFFFEQSNNKMYIESSATYTNNGKFIKSVKDSLDNEIIYDINPVNGLIQSLSNPNGDVTTYMYDDNLQITKVEQENHIVTYEYDADNNLSTISHGNKSYTLEYDEFNNNNITKLNNNIIINKEFEPNNGNLKKLTYGNNNVISYDYDKFNRVKKIIKGNNTFTNFYDNLGRIVKLTSNNDICDYEYDFAQRISKYSFNEFVSKYDYRKDNIIIKKIQELGLRNYTYDYEYNNDLTLTKISILNNSFNYLYDSLGRLSEKNINGNIRTKYHYITKGNKTSTTIDKVEDNGIEYTYVYDRLDNITEIRKNGELTNKYYYDNNSQLIKEEDYISNQIKSYSYDYYGNLLSKKIYNINDELLIKEDKYEYNNNLNDLLMKYNDDNITYDSIGNPLTIGNKSLTWINGHELSSYNDNNNIIEFNYDVKGIRTSKKVNNIETKYYLEDDLIIFESRAGTMLYYIYNLEGELLGLTLNNNTYYYHKNILGDIVGIIDTNYNEIVTYEYDSWGNITKMVDNSNINLGTMNPFRYRAYYYDTETDLYYLNSRYYSPKLGRFLSVDENIGAKEKVLSYNNYQYAFNNPITLVDEDGDWPKLPKLTRIVKNVVKVAAAATCIGVAWLAAATLTGPAGVVAGAAFIGATVGTIVGGVAGGVNASKKGENVVDGMLSGVAIGAFVGGVTGAVVSSVGIKTGAVKVVGDAQATGTALHRMASNVSAGAMSLNPIKYKEIYLDRALKTAGLAGTRRPDVIGIARFGKNKLVEVVSKTQTKVQMKIKLDKIIASGNPNCKKQVIDIARKISNLFKWK